MKRVLIDGDNFPNALWSIIPWLRKNYIPVIIFTNNFKVFENPVKKYVIKCGFEKEAADNRIISNVRPEDIIITQDCFLAKTLRQSCGARNVFTYNGKDVPKTGRSERFENPMKLQRKISNIYSLDLF